MDIVVANQIAELQAEISLATTYADIAIVIGVIFLVLGVIGLIYNVVKRDADGVMICLALIALGVIALVYALVQIFIEIPVLQTQLEQVKAMYGV